MIPFGKSITENKQHNTVTPDREKLNSLPGVFI